MSTQDRYEGFAERYDLFPQDPAEADFFRRLFARHQVSRVLDCACGTGRDLILFQALGCEVAGSDLSPAMLARARQNLAAAGLELPLKELDYRDLAAHFNRPFDAVVCLRGSLLEAGDEAEMLRALCSLRAVLRDGGLVVLTQGMTDKLWRERPRFILETDTAAFSRLFVIDYLDRGARFNVLDILRTPGESGLKVWSIDHPRVLLGADYERLLQEAGFTEIRLLGGCDFQDYDAETSDRLIVLARR